jgi:nitroreductase
MTKPTANDYPIDDLLRSRWSPLAFADRPIPAEALHSLFEAARWSPSSMNEQPWRFIVGSRDGTPETYAKLLDCLMPANQVWAQTAPVLLLCLGLGHFSRNGSPNPYALYDTGQAVAHLTIQASALDIAAHQMGGFDRDKARQIFAIPEDFVLGAVIALGYEGDPASLSDEKYRERHVNPVRERKPLGEIFLSGGDHFGDASPLI